MFRPDDFHLSSRKLRRSPSRDHFALVARVPRSRRSGCRLAPLPPPDVTLRRTWSAKALAAGLGGRASYRLIWNIGSRGSRRSAEMTSKALGYRVAEQRRDGEIGLQRRAHRLHVAHLAHRLPPAARLLQRRDATGLNTQVSAPSDTGNGSRACASPPRAPVHTSRSLRRVSPALPAAKLGRQRQIDGAGLELAAAARRYPCRSGVTRMLGNARLKRRRIGGCIAADDVVGGAEPDLALKRRLAQRGDQLIVGGQELGDGLVTSRCPSGVGTIRRPARAKRG